MVTRLPLIARTEICAYVQMYLQSEYNRQLVVKKKYMMKGYKKNMHL